MDVMQQCQQWHEADNHEAIVEALGNIPASERTPEMDMVLARAYSNLGHNETPEGRAMLRKALSLMLPHVETLGDTYSWNVRMGYAYYYLDQDGKALEYFRAALDLHPGDDPKCNTEQELREWISNCKEQIRVPRFRECFRERVAKAWEAFAKEEAGMRGLMDEGERKDELQEWMYQVLEHAFYYCPFEVEKVGQRYRLGLIPEDDQLLLFKQLYFCRHVPKEFRANWDIEVGIQPQRTGEISVDVVGTGLLTPDDIQAWLERDGNGALVLYAYCPKSFPLGWPLWALRQMIDRLIGEVARIAYLEEVVVLDSPKEGSSFPLSKLKARLKNRKIDVSNAAENYESLFISYEMEPESEGESFIRSDIFCGSTSCMRILDSYVLDDNTDMDFLHADGVVSGFFRYAIVGASDSNSDDHVDNLADFGGELQAALAKDAGPDAITILGGALGLRNGYIDFIAWDLQVVLKVAMEFFKKHPEVVSASFHTFRREAESLLMKVGGTDRNAGKKRSDAKVAVGITPIPPDRLQTVKSAPSGKIPAKILTRHASVDYQSAPTASKPTNTSGSEPLLNRIDANEPPSNTRQTDNRGLHGNSLSEVKRVTMDEGRRHMASLRAKELPVPELNAYSHLAIYLRWCMEHDLMSEAFMQKYGGLVTTVKMNPESVDLRVFVRDTLAGDLYLSLFNPEGMAFGVYYYDASGISSPYFPADIDLYAVGIIGKERNYSAEIQDEAYLFIPYDEAYYAAMSDVIDSRYAHWRLQRIDESTREPSALARQMMIEFFDCVATYIPSMADPDPIVSAFEYALMESDHKGYVPVLVAVEEELWGHLQRNIEQLHGLKSQGVQREDMIRMYRKAISVIDYENGGDILKELGEKVQAVYERRGIVFKGPRSEGVIGESRHGLEGYWREDGMTKPLLLLQIPVKEPWESIGNFPMGGWGDCPRTSALTGVARYWYEEFGAVPALVTSDSMEFRLPRPVPKDRIEEVARTHAYFCPSLGVPGDGGAWFGSLVSSLRESVVWRFQWGLLSMNQDEPPSAADNN